MKILISDKSSPRCAEILRAGGHQVDERNGLDPAALKAIIADYDGLIVRSATTVSSDLLSAAEKMKVIGRAGSGVDNIDLAAASERGMAVLNTPGGNSNSVAEMTLAFMLMMARDLYTAIHSLKSHRWEKKKFKGLEISGKSLGLLGYGRISRMVATKARAMGMVVLCYDPKISKNILDDDGLRITASLDELLTNSDYISMHLSKRDNTINFLDAAALEKVKPGCCIINCARGDR